MNKKKAEQKHALRRAKERYTGGVTPQTVETIRGKIKRQEGTFLYRKSRRVTVWEVPHEEVIYKVVYDKLRKEIVTFLPREDD